MKSYNWVQELLIHYGINKPLRLTFNIDEYGSRLLHISSIKREYATQHKAIKNAKIAEKNYEELTTRENLEKLKDALEAVSIYKKQTLEAKKTETEKFLSLININSPLSEMNLHQALLSNSLPPATKEITILLERDVSLISFIKEFISLSGIAITTREMPSEKVLQDLNNFLITRVQPFQIEKFMKVVTLFNNNANLYDNSIGLIENITQVNLEHILENITQVNLEHLLPYQVKRSIYLFFTIFQPTFIKSLDIRIRNTKSFQYNEEENLKLQLLNSIILEMGNKIPEFVQLIKKLFEGESELYIWINDNNAESDYLLNNIDIANLMITRQTLRQPFTINYGEHQVETTLLHELYSRPELIRMLLQNPKLLKKIEQNTVSVSSIHENTHTNRTAHQELEQHTQKLIRPRISKSSAGFFHTVQSSFTDFDIALSKNLKLLEATKLRIALGK